MPMKFKAKASAAEGSEFEYLGRIVRFREQDSPADHKNTIGADPDTEVLQLVVEIEGVSVEWIGDEGNRRRFTADTQSKTGEFKKGRNHKAWHILAPIIAPTDEDEARAVLDEKGRPVFVTRDRAGNETVTTGLGYDEEAPDFPEKLEGRVFKIVHRWIGFGLNKETGQEMRGMVPVLAEELPKTYVYDGTPAKITYKGRTAATREAGEATGADDGTTADPDPADPQVFFDAIAGRRLQLADLNEACSDPALRVEPYRTLIATRSGRQALVDKGYVSVEDDKTIATDYDVPTLDELTELAEQVQANITK